MGGEIDLLVNYPKAKRDVAGRGQEKTESDRSIARKFGKEFFDGERSTGYGGFSYSPRFWQPVIPTFQDHWSLTSSNSVLDVGCAKGFMMHDLAELIPGISVHGIDVSNYAIENVIPSMKPFVEIGSATKLPYPDKSFDVVISINTIHNLERDECFKAVQEIERVSRVGAFITVDAYNNEEEKERMYAWNLTAKTIMSVKEWVEFFKEAGYSGDFYWFIP